MKVLSLFDGMACGMIAMQLARVKVDSYDAYEIDKYAIKTAQHNFPMIKEHGDVFEADFTQYEGVDFLIGGSPCTYWSIAQTKNRETVASGMGWELFSQYVRALHEAKPKYFIYENNKSMSKQIRASIDDAFGFEAICINSALVSAQNRQRLYWVGKRNADGTYSRVNVEQPADRGVLLRDVLDTGIAWNEKAYNLTTRCCGAVPEDTLKRHRHTMVAEPVRGMGNDTKSRTITANYWKTNARDAFVDCAGGRTMVAEPINVTANGKAKTISASYAYKGDGEGSLKSELFPNNPIKQTSNYVAEPVCLRYERTEEAKRCRKAYEAHKIHHGYNELNELHPRPDGKTNTLTTVPKDNQIMEPVCVAERGRMYCGQPQHYEARTDGKTNTLTSVEKDNRVAEPVRCMQYELKEAYVRDSGCVARLDMPNCHDILTRVYGWNGKCPTLTAHGGGAGAKTGLYAIPYAIEFDDAGKPIKTIGEDGKEITIYEVKDGKITIKGKQYPIKLADGYYIIRKLTVRECMRLQTVPELYEFPVSDSQAYKMLGNGWTCEVIAHILKYSKEA